MTIALLILKRCAAKFRLRVGKRRNRSRKVMLNWRCIFDSLALLYADVLHEAAQLRGEDFSQLHIVGGGCQNTLLSYAPMPAVFG
ncbi:FGGY-family carbohydrate kinase [Escherichia coli]